MIPLVPVIATAAVSAITTVAVMKSTDKLVENAGNIKSALARKRGEVRNSRTLRRFRSRFSRRFRSTAEIDSMSNES